jgi:hypothetical protein
MGFNLGNAVKYIWRADLKNDAIEDLRKAVWYVQREIDRRLNANTAQQALAAEPLHKPKAIAEPYPHEYNMQAITSLDNIDLVTGQRKPTASGLGIPL